MKKSSYKLLISFIFIIFIIAFFIKEAYFWSVFLLFGLIPIAKLDEIINLVLKKDEFHIEFESSKDNDIEEKVKKLDKEIQENKQPITRQNYIRFQNIESKILADQEKKYGGEMKKLVHFIYGQPDKSQFKYTPDGSLLTNEALYFFEIKYILKPEFAKNIVENTTKYLKTIYNAFEPSVGKKLIIKLILTSGYDIDLNSFDIPKGIEIEFIKI